MSPDLRVLPVARPRGQPCTVDFEGRTLRAFEGESLAVALFADGVRALARSIKFHRPRGAFCFDGHCGSCLLRVDGRPNVRACMTPCHQGLRCEGQNAFPSTEVDFLEAADFMFPGGMDHQTLMTGHPMANRWFVKLVRQMGGSGRLPDVPAAIAPPARALRVDVVIVGAGPAGLSAAQAIRDRSDQASVMVIDEQTEVGGSWRSERDGQDRGPWMVERLQAARVTVLSGATAIGYFPEDSIGPDQRKFDGDGDGDVVSGVDGPGDAVPGILAVISSDLGLIQISARRFLYATGGYDQNIPFPDNDRPGVISARACGRLAFRHGIRPGDRVAIVGEARMADRLAAGLREVGLEDRQVVLVDPRQVTLAGVRGRTRVRGLLLRKASATHGAEHVTPADVIVVAATPAPASELARQHGAAVTFDATRGGFAVDVDDGFQTSTARVYACGDVTGYLGPRLAAEAGRAAGAAIAHTLESP